MALAVHELPPRAPEALIQRKRVWDLIDIGFVDRLMRDLIAEHGLSLELSVVRHEAHHWRVVVRDSNHRVSIEVHDLKTVVQLRTRLTRALLSVDQYLAARQRASKRFNDCWPRTRLILDESG